MNRFGLYVKIVLLFVFINGCSIYDDADLIKRLEHLNNRVNNIEKVLNSLNSDINSIKQLAESLQKRLYVSEIKKLSNGYIIIFSDGSEINIKNGTNGMNGADTPQISVMYLNNNYYWVKQTGLNVEWIRDSEGNLIPASGANGITPILKVDSDGYWIISYDNGYSFTTLLDIDENAIKASFEDGDSYFDSIETSNSEVTIILKDGSEIIFPLGDIPPLKSVDLGLSVKWASFNIGAASETDSGELYYWGDPDNSGGGNYEPPSLINICGTKYDIAKHIWGDSWRLPSKREQEELIFYCTWRRMTINGVSGMRVVGLNGNSIFLPPTGYRIYNSSKNELENGYYWVGESYISGNSSSYDYDYGYVFSFNSTSYYYNGGWDKEFSKLAVRPVKE